MAQIQCFLCDNQSDNAEYDINKTFTLYSKTRLLNFLQNHVVCGNENFLSVALKNNSILICNTCYCLLNELDNIQIRAKFINNQLKMYLESKFLPKTNHVQNDKEDPTPAEDLIEKVEEKIEPVDLKTKSKDLETLGRERRFICEICGQSYKKQKALDVHVGMHNGINPFTCTYCNKSFTQKGALARHMPIHTGQKLYQCDLCGKRFLHHTSINMHRLSHTGEKRHKCEICGILFMSVSHLKRHNKVHTGEKRFSCGICGKHFAEKYNLAVHEKLHSSLGSEKRKFQCQICGKVYNRHSKLEEHLFMTHEKSNFIPSDEAGPLFLEPTDFKVN